MTRMIYVRRPARSELLHSRGVELVTARADQYRSAEIRNLQSAMALEILLGEGVHIADGDVVVAIDLDVAALLVGGHDLVDPLAGGADEAGEVALGQAQGDVDRAVGRGLAVLLREGQDLAGQAALDIRRAERLNPRV